MDFALLDLCLIAAIANILFVLASVSFQQAVFFFSC